MKHHDLLELNPWCGLIGGLCPVRAMACSQLEIYHKDCLKFRRDDASSTRKEIKEGSEAERIGEESY
jgi:hypothetical protein